MKNKIGLEAPLSMCKAMLEIQWGLNTQFVGSNWTTEANKRERVDYATAILEEAQELQACDRGWKWWKSGHPAPDMSNAQLELIDMLHFVMSDAMANDADNRTTPGDTLDPEDVPNVIASVAERMAYGWVEAFHSVKSMTERAEYNPLLMRRGLHALVASSLQGYYGDAANLDDPLVDGDEPTYNNEFVAISSTSWAAFWATAYHLGMSTEDVYTAYVGKACLNAFRIANGDKAGAYARNWKDGKQDNYHLMAFLQDQTALGVFPSAAEVYSWLEQTYAEFQASEACTLIGAA